MLIFPYSFNTITSNGKPVQWKQKTGVLTNVAASFLTMLSAEYPDTMNESLITLA